MKRKDDRLKMWIGALIIAIFFGSSIHVAFANEDISTLLKSWFDKKEETAISNVETTIKKEQQAQTERLKKEIKEALDDAEQRLQTFTEDEKKQRKDELKQYADSLLENMELDDSEKNDRSKGRIRDYYERSHKGNGNSTGKNRTNE